MHLLYRDTRPYQIDPLLLYFTENQLMDEFISGAVIIMVQVYSYIQEEKNENKSNQKEASPNQVLSSWI